MLRAFCPWFLFNLQVGPKKVSIPLYIWAGGGGRRQRSVAAARVLRLGNTPIRTREQVQARVRAGGGRKPAS